MTYLKAIEICSKLNTWEEETDYLIIGEAIRKIISMETINAVKKDVLLNIVRWCFPMIFEVEDDCDALGIPYDYAIRAATGKGVTDNR